MKEYILKQWNNKKATVLLMMIGFIIGNMVLSVGTSLSVETLRQAYDSYSGNPNKQLEIDVTKDDDNVDGLLDLFEKIKNYGEIQLISLEKVELNDFGTTYQIVPVDFIKNEDWTIPIIEGEYFSVDNLKDEKKQIIIGKDVAKINNLKVGDTVKMNNMECVVIGISGRENRDTQWNNILYIPLGDFLIENKDYFLINNISIVLKSGKDDFINEFESIQSEFVNKNIEVNYMHMEEKSNESFYNSVILTIIATTLVFVIAIINISNLMIYWMLERKKDIAIMKAIGADNRYITKSLTIEIISISVISSLVAIILQEIMILILGEFLIKNDVYCTITFINFVISLIVTVICGWIATLIPAKHAMKIQPAEGLK